MNESGSKLDFLMYIGSIIVDCLVRGGGGVKNRHGWRVVKKVCPVR